MDKKDFLNELTTLYKKEQHKVEITKEEFIAILSRSESLFNLLRNSDKVVVDKDEKCYIEIEKLPGKTVFESYAVETSAELNQLVYKYALGYKLLHKDKTFIDNEGNEVTGVKDNEVYQVLDDTSLWDEYLSPELKVLAQNIKSQFVKEETDLGLKQVTMLMESRFDKTWTLEYTKFLPTTLFRSLLKVYREEFKEETEKK